LEKFKETVKTDIAIIAERFKKFVPLSDEPIFMEHYHRANAFLTCCQLDKKSDAIMLKKYVDAYGSLDEQMNIISECDAILLNSDKLRCKNSLEKLEEVRQLVRE
jgi:hypothetical protein